MSSADLKTGVVPESIARYFELALYLMVLCGFGTLAQTGQLDPPTVLLVILALVVRGYLILKRRTFILEDKLTQVVTLCFTIFYLVDFFWVSGNFVAATVHLVLGLMVVRLFSAHRDRDYVFLAILAFLSVLAASVLTVNSSFLIMFALFLLTAVATFILLEIRRSCGSAERRGRELSAADVQRLGSSLFGITPVLMLCILLVAGLIFFLLPRMSGGYLSAYAAGEEISSGFSERVQLGRIGEIQQSNSVVMHVQIDGDTDGHHDLLWRGVALSNFDGRNWFSPQKRIILPRWSDGRFVLSPPTSLQDMRTHVPKNIHYRVLLEPIGSDVFFIAPRGSSLSGNYHMLTMDEEGAVYDLDRDRPPTVYEAESDVGQPSAAQLRTAPTDLPATIWQQYMRPPAKLDDRIPELARQITGSAPTNYDKAVALESYLTSHYGYTLQLGRKSPADPLAYFLFERKEGHCEYFASAMAVMLRTLNIPSRVVNGFRTGEFNDVTGQYVIRARNAHSWVEVFFPNYGWISFDPTPGAGLETHSGIGRAMLYLDAISSFWREWVVNYDFGHQRTLTVGALRNTYHLGDNVRSWARDRYASMLSSTRIMRRSLMRSPFQWTATVIGVLAVVLLLIFSGAILSYFSRRRLAAHPEESPRAAAALWYARMTRSLARKGWQKSPAHTPTEFVGTISDHELQKAVSRFTSHYERARFGDSAEDAQRLPDEYEQISAVSKH